MDRLAAAVDADGRIDDRARCDLHAVKRLFGEPPYCTGTPYFSTLAWPYVTPNIDWIRLSTNGSRFAMRCGRQRTCASSISTVDLVEGAKRFAVITRFRSPRTTNERRRRSASARHNDDFRAACYVPTRPTRDRALGFERHCIHNAYTFALDSCAKSWASAWSPITDAARR